MSNLRIIQGGMTNPVPKEDEATQAGHAKPSDVQAQLADINYRKEVALKAAEADEAKERRKHEADQAEKQRKHDADQAEKKRQHEATQAQKLREHEEKQRLRNYDQAKLVIWVGAILAVMMIFAVVGAYLYSPAVGDKILTPAFTFLGAVAGGLGISRPSSSNALPSKSDENAPTQPA